MRLILADADARLRDLLRRRRKIRCIGFDDAPFHRESHEKVAVAGVVCAQTRFEGMVWGEGELDGWDATDVISALLVGGKFLPQLHVVLLDGIAFGGFNVVDLPKLARDLGRPCVAVMRNRPDFDAVDRALRNVSEPERRRALMRRAGPIHEAAPFVYQVCGARAETIARVLHAVTDTGNVPECLRLAHLIGAAVMTGESGHRA